MQRAVASSSITPQPRLTGASQLGRPRLQQLCIAATVHQQWRSSKPSQHSSFTTHSSTKHLLFLQLAFAARTLRRNANVLSADSKCIAYKHILGCIPTRSKKSTRLGPLYKTINLQENN